MIKVYDMDAKSVLEKVKNGKINYIEMALMPLMKNSSEKEIVELVDEEAKMKISRELKDDIITATLVMIGTVYDEKLVETLKRRVREMFNVDIFEKERKEAIEQGIQQGLQNGDMETLEYIADHIFDITLDEVKKFLSNS